MNDSILMVKEVSDGLLVQFRESGYCYFSTAFLVKSIGQESNQVFLDHDGCESAETSLGDLMQIDAAA